MKHPRINTTTNPERDSSCLPSPSHTLSRCRASSPLPPFHGALKPLGLARRQRRPLQKSRELRPHVLRPEEVGPHLEKGQRILNGATISGLNPLQARHVTAGKGEGIILAVELSTDLRPLRTGLRTAVTPLGRVMHALVQLRNAPSVPGNHAPNVRILFHDGRECLCQNPAGIQTGPRRSRRWISHARCAQEAKTKRSETGPRGVAPGCRRSPRWG